MKKSSLLQVQPEEDRRGMLQTKNTNQPCDKVVDGGPAFVSSRQGVKNGMAKKGSSWEGCENQKEGGARGEQCGWCAFIYHGNRRLCPRNGKKSEHGKPPGGDQ